MAKPSKTPTLAVPNGKLMKKKLESLESCHNNKKNIYWKLYETIPLDKFPQRHLSLTLSQFSIIAGMNKRCHTDNCLWFYEYMYMCVYMFVCAIPFDQRIPYLRASNNECLANLIVQMNWVTLSYYLSIPRNTDFETHCSAPSDKDIPRMDIIYGYPVYMWN